MGEFHDRFTASLTIRALEYVGYEEGDQLTRKVRRKPFSVVLFDEIEKASEIYNSLQVLEDGRLADRQEPHGELQRTPC